MNIWKKIIKKSLLSPTCILILSFPTLVDLCIPIENLQKKMNLRKVHVGVVYIANNCIYTSQVLPTSLQQQKPDLSKKTNPQRDL
jgi:hypothetical protein